MRVRALTAGLLALAIAAGLGASAQGGADGLVVHEWGTFLSMNGSDGVTLDGMYHEEHALPGFVHARGQDHLTLRTSNVKGETPVIYFYTDRPQHVEVSVGFPSGIWTQWYPQATLVGPALTRFGALPRVTQGQITWNVALTPAAGASPPIPAASADALWNHAREVDAAYVSASDATRPGKPTEWERFIFYRGLGAGGLPVVAQAGGGGTLTCDASHVQELKHVFVLQIENGYGAYRYLPSMACGRAVSDVLPAAHDVRPIDQFAPAIAEDLAARLVESGLYPKEARAMVNTWRSSYFGTDGVRVLFVLPQTWTDRYIPLRITPAPREIVRVMVGRIELLTPQRERRAESAILSLASPDAAVRERAFATLRAEGRYVEPIIRRTLETTDDERVRMLSRRLLVTDFVTELRTSLDDPSTRDLPKATYVRAQLASLLRDVGLDEEAKREGELALAALAQQPIPSMSDHNARNTYRALARAYEGVGDDRAALNWYADFVEFGNGFDRDGCTWCHGESGPRDLSFFKDWYAGRKFGELALKTGEAHRLMKENRATLDRNPIDRLSQIRLAYLYEANGDSYRAREIWARLLPEVPQLATAAELDRQRAR